MTNNTDRETDKLDELFNKTINAKQIAVDTVTDTMDLFENAKIAKEANILLDKLRTQFKQTANKLILEARIEELETLFTPVDGTRQGLRNRVHDRIKQLKEQE